MQSGGGTNPPPTFTPLNGNEENTPTDKVYKYTVSGAGTTEANGDYWELEEKYTDTMGFEITQYTNGNCLLYHDAASCYICRGTSLPNQSSDVLYTRGRGSEDFLGMWMRTVNAIDPAPTVTEY